VDVSLSVFAWARRSASRLPGKARRDAAALEEIEEAETEGIIMHPGLGPKRMIGKDGR